MKNKNLKNFTPFKSTLRNGSNLQLQFAEAKTVVLEGDQVVVHVVEEHPVQLKIKDIKKNVKNVLYFITFLL